MTGGDTTNKGTKFEAAGVELQENEAYGTSRVIGIMCLNTNIHDTK